MTVIEPAQLFELLHGLDAAGPPAGEFNQGTSPVGVETKMAKDGLWGISLRSGIPPEGDGRSREVERHAVLVADGLDLVGIGDFDGIDGRHGR